MNYKHIYGPIPSRRLGVSLGIDPIPFKTCPLNCIYCECGATNNFTMERKEYIAKDLIMTELDHFMQNNEAPDYITFSGSGEPTLNSSLGEMIKNIKSKYPTTNVAVITNSVMLSIPSLQNELINADLVAPSLDAVSKDAFLKIDHPMKEINLDQIVYSLENFAKNFLSYPNKQLWIEIFVVEDVNDTDEEISQFINVLKNIPYSRIQLNRLDRIGTKLDLRPASMSSLYKIKDHFEDAGLENIEIIGKFKKRDEIRDYENSLEEVLISNLSRRSLSLEDIELMSGKTKEEIGQYLDILNAENKIITKIIEGQVFYKYKTYSSI